MKCKVCGKEFDPNEYIKGTAKSMARNEMCFDCHFWSGQHELDVNGYEDGSPRIYAIVGGTHFVLGGHTDSYFKGYGGRKFYFRYNDGTLRESSNVWCQGDIPERFRDIMPDNAVCISEDEYNRLNVAAE